MFERKHIPAAIAALGTNDHHPSFAKRAWEEVGELFDKMGAEIEALKAKLEGKADVTQNALQTLPASDASPSSTEPAQAAAPAAPAAPAVAPAPAVPQPAAAA